MDQVKTCKMCGACGPHAFVQDDDEVCGCCGGYTPEQQDEMIALSNSAEHGCPKCPSGILINKPLNKCVVFSVCNTCNWGREAYMAALSTS